VTLCNNQNLYNIEHAGYNLEVILLVLRELKHNRVSRFQGTNVSWALLHESALVLSKHPIPIFNFFQPHWVILMGSHMSGIVMFVTLVLTPRCLINYYDFHSHEILLSDIYNKYH
jgi:hypothetical protein